MNPALLTEVRHYLCTVGGDFVGGTEEGDTGEQFDIYSDRCEWMSQRTVDFYDMDFAECQRILASTGNASGEQQHDEQDMSECTSMQRSAENSGQDRGISEGRSGSGGFC